MCKIMEEIHEKGWEEGREEIMVDWVNYMLKEGKHSLEEISRVTKLSLEEIKRLKAAQGV